MNNFEFILYGTVIGYFAYPIAAIVRKIWQEALIARQAEIEDMGNVSDYFEKNAYKPKYSIGDRVIGKWNKIPFVGSVGNDTLISEIDGPQVSVHLDLPISHKGNIHNLLIVKHKDIRPLLEIVDDSPIKKTKSINKKN